MMASLNAWSSRAEDLKGDVRFAMDSADDLLDALEQTEPDQWAIFQEFITNGVDRKVYAMILSAYTGGYLRGHSQAHGRIVNMEQRMALAQVLADAYGPVGLVEEMPAEERQTFLDMADAAIEHFGKPDRE